MGFPRLTYVIPVLALSNTLFLLFFHSSYLDAIEQLNKQKNALEDIRYHLENNPNVEMETKFFERQDSFSRWWHGANESSDHPTQLIIAIPAVPRPQRYLTNTLAALLEQLPSTNHGSDTPWRNNIQVYIVNNKPGEFPEFDELRTKHSSVPEFVFLENTEKQEDRFAHLEDPDDFNNPNDIPGKKVRHQTYDLISLMKLAKNKSRYFMFMEDDFPVCPKALDTFYYVLRKAKLYQPNWKAIRTSYGMNGIFVDGNELQSLAAFFDENVAHRPPDGLVVEWMCGKLSPTQETCEKPQRHFTFRWNLFRHIGAVSSLRQTGLQKFPGCWEEYSDLLWEVDSFNVDDCNEDDLWPCNSRPYQETIHTTLDIDGWPYINGYINVQRNGDEVDVSLRQRSLRLLWSGYTSSSSSRPAPFSFSFNLFMVIAFFTVAWKMKTILANTL
jgi:hypothetical protein